MLKRLINIIWTYSLQDYWNTIWSKTSVDEKAIATVRGKQYSLKNTFNKPLKFSL